MGVADELWTRCTSSLRERVSDATWQMWLSRIKPVSFEGGLLVLSAPNGVVRERVESRFAPQIAETLTLLSGTAVEVRVVLDPAAADEGANRDEPSFDPPVSVGVGTAVAPLRPRERETTVAVKVPGARESAAVALDPRFTFETFVAAASNRLAHAAAQAVAETPGRSYNPLFIYGESGLGKTHLLHAIGNYVQENYPNRIVLYVTTETFMNDFVDSLRMSSTISFKRRYRVCDVLLIDDVQFMENKEGLQEEFFHTYNDLYSAGKQIVLTSDRSPKSIDTLEDRLRSRFLSGLITGVDPPDVETRLAILRSKTEMDKEDIPDDVLEFIATHVTSNIRELEGALIRVTAFASLSHEPVSLELAEKVLPDIVAQGEPRRITPQMILDATAAHYAFSVDALCGPSRTRPLVSARQVAMYLVRNLTDYSFPAIGRVFGGRDHTTVIHAVSKVADQMKERRQVYEQVTELTLRIRNGS